MIIAQMTDIHIGFDPKARPEELNRQRFCATLERLLTQPNTPDMLMVTGDITDRGDADSFIRTAQWLEKCPFPVHPLVGNHDSREELLRAFPGTPSNDGFVQYVIEQDGLLIIALDTMEPGRHGGAFCPARRNWLKAVLAENKGAPTVIFMHHPPIISGIAWMDPHEGEPWLRNLADALAGFEDQVRAIHCGHLHRQLNGSFCGIPVSVTPAVAPLVSMDLRPIDAEMPDNRPLITTEPATYALHLWQGGQLVSHYERVSDWDVLAYYGPHLQPMIREMEAEKRPG